MQMIRYKIKDTAFEMDPKAGTAKVITAAGTVEYKNAIEAWVTFSNYALVPLEMQVRDALEENGFNRWTGTKKLDYTESELKDFDLQQDKRAAVDRLKGDSNV